MNYLLVIMTFVGASSYTGEHRQFMGPVYDWRPVGEFMTKDLCQKAGRELKREHEFKCLEKK